MLSLVAVAVTQVPTARPLDRLKLICGERRSPAGHDRRRAEERLALPEARGIGDEAAEELDQEGGAGDAGERAADIAAGAAAARTRDRSGQSERYWPSRSARSRGAPLEKMLFERIESPVPDCTSTPAATLNAIVLPWPPAVPPTVLLDALLLKMMPLTSLPSGRVPETSVPMLFPSMMLPVAVAPSMPYSPMIGRDHVARCRGRPSHRIVG